MSGFNNRSPTPAISILHDDCTSSCNSEQSTTRSVPPNKKHAQEVMKSFPPATDTAYTKRKTNWSYNQSTKPGVHRIVVGEHDHSFMLHEAIEYGYDVKLMSLNKWHMILKLHDTGLTHSHRKWLLICRLKLKANYKVRLQNNEFYDVNAEDCRMNLNPEGCFLIEEAEWERCGKNVDDLKDLAKFQDKRNCKAYKECKNSVVRAGQKIDSVLRDKFFEEYMDILYEKAFKAKKNATKKSDDEVRKIMGQKPNDWQSKRSIAWVGHVDDIEQGLENMAYKRSLQFAWEGNSTTSNSLIGSIASDYRSISEDLYKPQPSPSPSASQSTTVYPEDSASGVGGRMIAGSFAPLGPLTQSQRRQSYPEEMNPVATHTALKAEGEEPAYFPDPARHPSEPLPPIPPPAPAGYHQPGMQHHYPPMAYAPPHGVYPPMPYPPPQAYPPVYGHPAYQPQYHAYYPPQPMHPMHAAPYPAYHPHAYPTPHYPVPCAYPMMGGAN